MSAESSKEYEGQKWEYKILPRSRGVAGGGLSAAKAAQWNPPNLESLSQMGEEGWELVAVVSESGIPNNQTAGFTSDELWVFKRLKL